MHIRLQCIVGLEVVLVSKACTHLSFCTIFGVVRIFCGVTSNVHTGQTYEESHAAAAKAAIGLGVLIEENHLYDLCTSNLHQIVCHLLQSEERGGALKFRKEFYVEVFIGIMKRVTVNRVTAEPERC